MWVSSHVTRSLLLYMGEGGRPVLLGVPGGAGERPMTAGYARTLGCGGAGQGSSRGSAGAVTADKELLRPLGELSSHLETAGGPRGHVSSGSRNPGSRSAWRPQPYQCNTRRTCRASHSLCRLSHMTFRTGSENGRIKAAPTPRRHPPSNSPCKRPVQ